MVQRTYKLIRGQAGRSVHVTQGSSVLLHHHARWKLTLQPVDMDYIYILPACRPKSCGVTLHKGLPRRSQLRFGPVRVLASMATENLK